MVTPSEFAQALFILMWSISANDIKLPLWRINSLTLERNTGLSILFPNQLLYRLTNSGSAEAVPLHQFVRSS